MERLPNDVVDIIIALEPQLALSCRRFWHILEHQSRSLALRTLGDLALLDSFRADCKAMLGLSSWGVVANLVKYDFWFFGPQHIVDLQDGDISDASSPDDKADLEEGVWRQVHGLKWGTSLYASNVLLLHLRYQTKLRPGRYRVCISLRVGNFVNLYPIKFSCIGQSVTQLGSIYPTVHLDTNNNHPDCMYEYSQYLQFRSCELCIGLIDVEPMEDPRHWPLVTFEIEDNRPRINRGILLNYLYFERVSEDYPPNDFWALSRKKFWPTPQWVQLFDRNSQRKFATV